MARKTLDLPKLWTLSEERVVEALVCALEAQGKEMPGLKTHTFELHRTESGEFVLACCPYKENPPTR